MAGAASPSALPVAHPRRVITFTRSEMGNSGGGKAVLWQMRHLEIQRHRRKILWLTIKVYSTVWLIARQWRIENKKKKIKKKKERRCGIGWGEKDKGNADGNFENSLVILAAANHFSLTCHGIVLPWTWRKQHSRRERQTRGDVTFPLSRSHRFFLEKLMKLFFTTESYIAQRLHFHRQ